MQVCYFQDESRVCSVTLKPLKIFLQNMVQILSIIVDMQRKITISQNYAPLYGNRIHCIIFISIKIFYRVLSKKKVLLADA